MDDKKKNPYQDQSSQDQQKGGEATATDTDVTDVTDDSTEGLEDTDLTEDTSVEEDVPTSTGSESGDEENM